MRNWRIKRRTAALDVGIVLAVAVFFVAGVFFESRRSRGELPVVAPNAEAAATSTPTGGTSDGSEAAESTQSPQSTATAPQSTPTPGAVIPAGTPNPEAVGSQVFIELSGIENESVIEGSSVSFTGTTTPDALVSVNGQSTEVDLGGNFTVDLSLDPGPNFIEIVSSNLRGQATSRVLSVVSIQ